MADLTVEAVMAAHAQFGLLNRELVKRSMGKNWPSEWDSIQAGEGIWAAPDLLHRRSMERGNG